MLQVKYEVQVSVKELKENEHRLKPYYELFAPINIEDVTLHESIDLQS